MSAFAVSQGITYITETCCNCGVPFAMPQWFHSERSTNGGSFHCPNGHSQHYTKPEVLKLREQLEAKERELRQSKCETINERNLRDAVEKQKASAERKLRRVHRGVCPCCKRSFQNLARHMETKHPEAKSKTTP